MKKPFEAPSLALQATLGQLTQGAALAISGAGSSPP